MGKCRILKDFLSHTKWMAAFRRILDSELFSQGHTVRHGSPIQPEAMANTSSFGKSCFSHTLSTLSSFRKDDASYININGISIFYGPLGRNMAGYRFAFCLWLLPRLLPTDFTRGILLRIFFFLFSSFASLEHSRRPFYLFKNKIHPRDETCIFYFCSTLILILSHPSNFPRCKRMG